jgi:hypothetical protein
VNYPEKDMQDILAMSAFQFVYSTLVLKENAEQATLISEIKDLNDDIDDFLASQVSLISKIDSLSYPYFFLNQALPKRSPQKNGGFFYY